MSLVLEKINPFAIPYWDELLQSHPQASIFHSAAWARTIAESYGYKPIFFARLDQGKVEALIPVMDIKSGLTGRRGVSLPFTDYCDPILPAGMELPEAIEPIIAYGKRASWKVLELRDSSTAVPAYEPSYVFLGHSLDLSRGEEALYAGLKSNTKRNLKKAAREGIEVTFSTGMEAMRTFYRLNCLTRKRHGLPPQPQHFFANLHRHLISRDHGVVALATYQNNVIAAAVYLYFGDKAVYKYGASDPAFFSLRPNNQIMWEAIKYFAQRGYRSFCFGKTDPENEGLRRFKLSWGADEHEVFYYKYDLRANRIQPEKSSLAGLHTRVFAKTPILVLKMIGAVLYRHIG